MEWGTDGFQTDHPEELIRYLRRRAQRQRESGE